MTLIRFLLTILLLTSSSAFSQTSPAPIGDYHQHVGSQALAKFMGFPAALTAQDVIKHLDDAGIRRGVLLSIAYAYGRPGREPQNEYEKVKEENDWVGAQAALFPDRLVAFCGFNPLKDYAVAEVERCAKNPNTRRGIKLHFGNSDVQLEKPEHIEKLKAVFRAANANGMAIVIHMRASISLDRPYGAEQVRAFLDQLLPLATQVPVQVAHLAGSGPGFDDAKQDAALDAFTAVLKDRWWKDTRYKNLWFDLTSCAHPSNSPARTALLLKRIREIGPKRILYGSDAAIGPNLRPREAWAEVTKIGLSKDELKTIANNRPPYWK